jgi:hypothetical protein
MTLMAYNYHADDNVQDTLHKRERKWNEEVEEAQDSGSMESRGSIWGKRHSELSRTIKIGC